MRFINVIKVALRALRRSALRSVLTALGIIIGVAAVIAMVSIGNGAKSQVEASIASLGQNLINVFPGNFTSGAVRGGWGSASSLTIEDAEAIQREVAGVAALTPELRDRTQVLANGLNWNTQVLGEDVAYLDIRLWSIADGEMFSEFDVRSGNKVCVIGRTVANQLFPDSDPIDQSIRIRNIPFKVVGVLAAKGFNYFGQDQDDVLIIPYTSYLQRIARRPNLNSILVQAVSPDVMSRVQQDITDLLQQRRNGREPDFTVRNQQELAEAATATTKTMTVLLGAIAGVSLIVGGIGIMNIMLVSVTERTREIGIRLAVGAHGRDVLTQFLIEAIILSVLGGALGVLLGIGTSQLVSHLNKWPVLISTNAIVGAVAFSAVIGVFFGFYPARKAAQLDPIEALRYE
ncbi:Macrolide export ATP-binding/permease protein MacB [Lacunisphaera limnophila]|jgi:putative ABC transport system permease protein|uniref:Macrolide export ATP-binding/permease protein MacB n=1 Tax=Lacunisphaera limnophila TaxID=1838286 RepID=A0A1D8AXE0_9BACT|nr:ABC transporter permease [Lacunisphaera limnophila]AOS45546.1 Macrolide export ATP-binding/permease protein MacB [Lacunisphaera limnophila]